MEPVSVGSCTRCLAVSLALAATFVLDADCFRGVGRFGELGVFGVGGREVELPEPMAVDCEANGAGQRGQGSSVLLLPATPFDLI